MSEENNISEENNAKIRFSGIFKGKNLAIFVLSALVAAMTGVIITQNVLTSSQKTLSGQEVASRAVEYINSRLLQGKVKAEITGKPERVENCLYKFGLKVGNQEFESYATVSGTLLFPAGYEIAPQKAASRDKEAAVSKKTNSSSQKDAAKQCASLDKSNQPVLEAFVVSYCPFGLQMQRILTEIVKNIPQLKNYIKVRYIGSVVDGKVRSMHGSKEAAENLRQVCIREEQQGKFFDYLGCFIQRGNSEKCLENAKIDSTKLAQCMADPGRGVKYIEKDFDEQGKYEVAGSPTLVLNGSRVNEFNFGGRTAQAVKALLCCGFNNQPSFCSKDLTGQKAAVGFSDKYSGKGSSGGKCN